MIVFNFAGLWHLVTPKHGLHLAVGLAAVGLLGTAQGAILTDLVLKSQIDESGRQSVDVEAVGATPESTLEAFGVNVVTDMRDNSNFPSPGQNHTLVFTDPTLPDILLQRVQNHRSNSMGPTSNGDTPSNGEGIFLINDGGSTDDLITDIEFGSFNSGSFTPFTNQGVAAAGFTLGQIQADNTTTVRFFSPSGSLLSTQTVVGPASGEPNDFYFGLIDETNLIGRIEIIRTNPNGVDAAVFADLAFSSVEVVIPEPASLMLLATGAFLIAGRRRSGLSA